MELNRKLCRVPSIKDAIRGHVEVMEKINAPTAISLRPKNERIIMQKDLMNEMKKCKTFYDFLKFVRDARGLEMVQDNGWYWLEFLGEKIEGSGKERFTSSSEMDDLMKLAGIKN